MASTAYGYSVRASSLRDLEELKSDYRSIEKLLSYGLPADATADDRSNRTAETAPKRQFYFPEINKRQVLGQIAYRPKDTAGRVGSYFAHLLVSRDTKPWDPLDCLAVLSEEKKGAASFWKDFDIDGPFPELVSVESLAALQVEEAKTRMDYLVSIWFKGLPNELPSESVAYEKSFTEWAKNYSAEGRMALVSSLSQRLIESNSPKSIILVTEPRVAAVIFYAALRVLPFITRQRISFSTFESDPLRSNATLVASTSFSSDDKLLEGLSTSGALVGCENHYGVEKARTAVGDTSDWFYYSVACLRDGKAAAVDRFLDSVDKTCEKTNVVELTSKMLNGLFKINSYVTNLFNRRNAQPKPLRNRSLPEPLQEFLIRNCLKFICSPKTRDNLGQEYSSKILPIIQGIFQARVIAWERLQKDPEIGGWLQSALPTDESGVISVLCKPEQIASNRTALDLLKKFASQSGRLPPLEAERLWANVKKLSEFLKSPEASSRELDDFSTSRWLLVRLLLELDNKEPLIVPAGSSPFIYSAVALVINNAIDSPEDSWSLSENAILRKYLTKVLDEASGSIPNQQEFEHFMSFAAKRDGATHVGVLPLSSKFLGRVQRLSGKLNSRFGELCKDGQPYDVLKPWSVIFEQEAKEEFDKKLQYWSLVLRWFSDALKLDKSHEVFLCKGTISDREIVNAIVEITKHDKTPSELHRKFS